MEKFFDSSSSLLAEYDVNSKGHKRKESSNEGKECSSAATSSNVPWPSSGMKLQKTSETSASSNLLHRLDSREFGSVAKQIGVLEARKLHLLQLFSKLNSRSQLSHLELEKKRLVNQQTIRVTQSDIINLENEPPRVHMIAGDVPIVILNSDDEDGGYQEHYHTYQKDVLIELAHQLPDKALTVNDSQEVKAPKFTAKSIPASYDTQVDEIAYTETENDKKVKENEKVIVSRNVVGSSPANCNILANEIAYARKVNGVQFINIERFEASGNVVGNSITKCNIQVDLNTSADMVRKDKNHQIDVGDNSLAKNDTENDTHVRDKVSRDAVRAKCNNQVDESAQNNMIVENGNHHHIDVGDNSLAKKDSGNDTHVRDKGSWDADRAKCNIQVDESADSGKNNIIVENDNHQLDVEDYGLTKIGIENDIEDRDCTKFKAVSDVEGSPTKCNNQLYESAFVGKESNIVIEQDNHQVHVEDDDLDKIWKEMSFALECCKDSVADPATDECVEEHGEECDHSFILKDDLGHVCRICGVIWRSIDTIIEFQSAKVKRSSRTYAYECRITNSRESIDVIPGLIKSPNIMVTEIAAHPRHRKEMKPHQVEGFNFLCSNLVTDDPGGCILAHAPGSGKTFMIISFIQSFLAKYPDARPLVVLPKGIMATWKNEFLKWQVDEIRLHDFYSSKAENRSQQLDILKKWVKERSILFLGYKQLSVIVCDNSRSKEAAECQDILLKVPTILILDEGHTPRNEETDVLQSLSKVRTPRKVVLSGTLYQNHVKEVFNILNLVRPRFLKLKASRMIVNRVLGRVEISKVRKHLKAGTDSAFFDLVEYTLQKDEDFRRRKAVIQDLREMTSNVLHYYKGDFLDELPGLVDFTAVLNLSPRQKDEVQTLRKLDKFKRTSLGSAMYIHPQLKSLSQMCSVTGEKGSIVDDEKIDAMLQELDIREGVKAKFFLTILGLCESAGEKLLVFSQYILPLKLLERLSAKMKGWKSGREIFMITGDSSTEQREWCMEHFNSSPNARVFFGSIKACGEGISLVGASRILILDVHLNPSVTRQAIGRAFRPGQKKKVYTYRLVAADSPEQEDYLTCSRKELISKTWFEWNENCADQDFEVKTIDVHECGDIFFESLGLREDLNVLYKR